MLATRKQIEQSKKSWLPAFTKIQADTANRTSERSEKEQTGVAGGQHRQHGQWEQNDDACNEEMRDRVAGSSTTGIGQETLRISGGQVGNHDVWKFS